MHAPHVGVLVGIVMNPYMNKDTFLRHFLVPALMPVLFFAVAFSPVELLGCRTRGLIALSIALLSGTVGVFTAGMALKGSVKGEAGWRKWSVTSLILVIPVVAFLVLA